MDEEVAKWLEQAEKDMDDAEYLLKGGRLKFTLFACEQAVEKGLKALELERKGTVTKTHELTDLARAVALPEQLRPLLDELSDAYVATRYPVESAKDPDHETTQELLQHSKEVLTWIKKQLSDVS